MKVSRILRSKQGDTVTVSPDMPVLEAAAELARHRIGAVIVLDADGSLAGIISERDIARALPERGPDLSRLKVADLMTREVTVCNPDHDVHHVMKQMTEGAFRHVPVVDGDRLAGIISIGDVVRARIDELEHEAADLQRYIVG